MGMQYATITGRVTLPNSDIGVRAEVSATPMTTEAGLKFPAEDRITWGSATAETDAAGNLAALKIPLGSAAGSSVIWRLVAKTLDREHGHRGPKTWVLYEGPITASADLADLVSIELLAVTPDLVETVAEYAGNAEGFANEAEAAAASIKRDQPNGVAPLDASSRVPQPNLPPHLAPADLAVAYSPRVTAPQNAIRRMASGSDARILVVTDSTGDSTTEWPYLLASNLAAKWTRNTTRWIPANSTGTGYDAAVTIATGTGAGTTSVYSAALAGRHSTAFQGQALNALIESTNPHVVIVALGHNDGLFTGDSLGLGNPAEAYRLRMLALTESIRYTVPHAPIMLMSQNAWQDGGGDMGLKRDELRALAQARGYDLLDVYQAWTEVGSATTSGYYLDNVHPNAAGSQFIAGLVIDTFRTHYNTPPRTEPPSLLGLSSRSIIPPLEMPVGATVPVGWNKSNVDVYRNTVQYETTRGYSVRLVRSASPTAGVQARIYKQVLNATQVLPYRAKWVTLACRVRRTAASRFVGRIMVNDDTVTSKSYDDDFSYGDFTWVLVPHKVAAGATQLTVSLFADATTNASATDADVSFDRLALFPGLWPTGHADLAPTSDGTWVDYTPTLGNFAATIDYAKFTMLNAKTVKVQFAATLTAAVTGQPTISLPLQASGSMPSGDKAPIGLATAFDTGVARYIGTVQKMNLTTAAFTGTPGAWSATVPFTWGTGDVIAATFEYQVD